MQPVQVLEIRRKAIVPTESEEGSFKSNPVGITKIPNRPEAPSGITIDFVKEETSIINNFSNVQYRIKGEKSWTLMDKNTIDLKPENKLVTYEIRTQAIGDEFAHRRYSNCLFPARPTTPVYDHTYINYIEEETDFAFNNQLEYFFHSDGEFSKKKGNNRTISLKKNINIGTQEPDTLLYRWVALSKIEVAATNANARFASFLGKITYPY